MCNSRKQACEGCRQRKRKCDVSANGRQPSCTTCRKARVLCVYALRPPATQLGIAMHYSPAPSNAYTPFDPQIANFGHHNGFDDALVSQDPRLDTGDEPIPASSADSFLPWMFDLNQSMNQPFAAWSQNHPSGLPFSSIDTDMTAGSVNSQPYSAGGNGGHSTSGASGSSVANNHSPGSQTQFPTHSQVLSLASVFFDAQHTLLPCIHRETFMRKLQQDGGLTNTTPLLWIIIALASSCDTSHESQAYYHQWSAMARNKLDEEMDALLGTERTMMLQAFVWIVFDSFCRGRLTTAWLWLGKACQVASALGVHHIDATGTLGAPRMTNSDCSILELEERRKTMWCFFLLDRVIGSTNGLPLSLNEQAFQVSFPVADDAFQNWPHGMAELEHEKFSVNAYDLLDSNTTSNMVENPNLSHLFKAAVIMGRATQLQSCVHRKTNGEQFVEEVQPLHIILQTFCAATSRHTKRTEKGNALHRTWLVLMLQCSRLLMLHPALSTAEGLCECKTDSNDSSAFHRRSECLEAAETMVSTFKHTLEQCPSALHNPFLLSLICVAVRVLAKDPRSAASEAQIRILESAVDRIQEKFPHVASRCHDAIQARIRPRGRPLYESGVVSLVDFYCGPGSDMGQEEGTEREEGGEMVPGLDNDPTKIMTVIRTWAD